MKAIKEICQRLYAEPKTQAFLIQSRRPERNLCARTQTIAAFHCYSTTQRSTVTLRKVDSIDIATKMGVNSADANERTSLLGPKLRSSSLDTVDRALVSEIAATPLPRAKLGVVLLIFLSEALSLFIILPFISYMVKSFHITEDEKALGYYAGTCGAISGILPRYPRQGRYKCLRL
jgi:hypothetical protein